MLKPLSPFFEYLHPQIYCVYCLLLLNFSAHLSSYSAFKRQERQQISTLKISTQYAFIATTQARKPSKSWEGHLLPHNIVIGSVKIP